MSVTCSICGTTNPDPAGGAPAYCEGCGVELTAQHPETAQAHPTPGAPETSPPAPDPAVSGEAGEAQAPSETPPEMAAEAVDEQAGETEAEPVPVDTHASPEDAASEPEAREGEMQTPATESTAEAAAAEATKEAAPEAAEAGTASLVIKRHGVVTDERITLAGERMSVGRFDPSTGPVDIDVSALPGAEHISRRHAEVYREGSAWFVRDLGSTNGVFVKPKDAESFSPRVQTPTELHDGDEVAFGNVTFVFEQS